MKKRLAMQEYLPAAYKVMIELDSIIKKRISLLHLGRVKKELLS
ncbi:MULTISPECIES: hypothetical protein [Chitinophaga]|nr:MULTISPECIES: hypothetical protein [Chitinophaga]